jgi:hypothetical protein
LYEVSRIAGFESLGDILNNGSVKSSTILFTISLNFILHRMDRIGVLTCCFPLSRGSENAAFEQDCVFVSVSKIVGERWFLSVWIAVGFGEVLFLSLDVLGGVM